MMEEEARNGFEKSLRESAKDFRMNPSTEVWEGVRERLHGTRRIAPVWWWSAAAAVVLGLGIWGVSRYERPGKQAVSHASVPAASPAAAGALSGKTVQGGQERASSVPGQGAPGIASGDSALARPAASVPPSAAGASTLSRPAPGSAGESRPAAVAASPAKPMQPGFPAAASRVVDVSLPAACTLPVIAGNQASLLIGSAIPTRAEASASAEAWHAPVIPDSALQGPLYGKHSPKADLPASRLSWGVYLTPGIGYRVFSTRLPHQTNTMNMDPGTSGSRPGLTYLTARRPVQITYEHRPERSWAAGARVYYRLTDAWSLQSGVSVSQTGYRARVYEASAAYVNRSGVAQPADAGRTVNSGAMSYAASATIPKTSDFNVRYLAIEVPVMVHRSIPARGSLAIDLGAGAGLSYLAGSNSLIYSPVSGRYFSDERCLRDLNADLHLEASLAIPVSRHLHLTAGPAVQYQATSSYKGYNLVREHPYFAGLQLGAKWVP
jgi:hypothetical protein